MPADLESDRRSFIDDAAGCVGFLLRSHAELAVAMARRGKNPGLPRSSVDAAAAGAAIGVGPSSDDFVDPVPAGADVSSGELDQLGSPRPTTQYMRALVTDCDRDEQARAMAFAPEESALYDEFFVRDGSATFLPPKRLAAKAENALGLQEADLPPFRNTRPNGFRQMLAHMHQDGSSALLENLFLAVEGSRSGPLYSVHAEAVNQNAKEQGPASSSSQPTGAETETVVDVARSLKDNVTSLKDNVTSLKDSVNGLNAKLQLLLDHGLNAKLQLLLDHCQNNPVPVAINDDSAVDVDQHAELAIAPALGDSAGIPTSVMASEPTSVRSEVLSDSPSMLEDLGAEIGATVVRADVDAGDGIVLSEGTQSTSPATSHDEKGEIPAPMPMGKDKESPPKNFAGANLKSILVDKIRGRAPLGAGVWGAGLVPNQDLFTSALLNVEARLVGQFWDSLDMGDGLEMGDVEPDETALTWVKDRVEEITSLLGIGRGGIGGVWNEGGGSGGSCRAMERPLKRLNWAKDYQKLNKVCGFCCRI